MIVTEQKICLFHTKNSLYQTSTQTHIEHRFFVPRGTGRILVSFNYLPVILTDQNGHHSLIDHALNYYVDLDKDQVKDITFRNLLTVSIDDPAGFRGAAHRSVETQDIVLAENEATPGFLKGAIQEGLWSVTISVHEILTEMCSYELKIDATGIFHNKLIRERIWQNYFGLESMEKSKKSYQPMQLETKLLQWVPAELHCHTNHSDGKQSLEELAAVAKQRGLEVVAITDHNTTSPLQEKERVEQTSGVKIINGLEWTTFFGHVLTLGYKTPQYSEWRKIGPTDIHRGIMEIKALGALVGIAHPYRPGNPFCTGCYFEYEVRNIEDFDYIEVWNSESPSLKHHNQRAYQLWTDLLNKGYHLPAVSGRDWHNNTKENPLIATTYILVNKGGNDKQDFEQDMLTSIKQGRLSVSYGGPLELTVEFKGLKYQIGDSVKVDQEEVTFHVNIPNSELWHSSVDIKSLNLHIVSNLGAMHSKPAGNHCIQYTRKGTGLHWVRAELTGLVDGQESIIGFTNAIYFV